MISSTLHIEPKYNLTKKKKETKVESKEKENKTK